MDKERLSDWLMPAVLLTPHLILLAALYCQSGDTGLGNVIKAASGLATIIGVIIAWSALGTWKRQLKGAERFKIEKKLIEDIYKIKKDSYELATEASRIGPTLISHIKRNQPYDDLHEIIQDQFSTVANSATNLENESYKLSQKVKDLFDKKHPTSLPPEEIIQSIDELTKHATNLSRDIHKIFNHFNNSNPPMPLNEKQSEQIKESFNSETTRIELSQQKTIKIIKNSYK